MKPRPMRVSGDIYLAVKTLAAAQRRSITEQLAIVAEAGFDALGHNDILRQARHDAVHCEGQIEAFPEGDT